MSQTGVYGESKMIWWYTREGQLPETAKQVQLILSDLCSQDCHFCAYRVSGNPSNELFVGKSEKAKIGTNNPKRWIPTDRALKLLEEFVEAGVLSVQFTGGGEPTVHPEHERIFARALELGLRCSLVSNGVKWSYTLIKEVLPQFDWVRVSIDAGDPDTYVTTRRCPPQHWRNVWENVRTLSAALEASKSLCVFGLGFVVTPESYKEIPAFTALAKAAGAGWLIAVDPSKHARENALRLGATHAVDTTDGDARDAVYKIIPKGPDVVVEAAGPIEAVELMVRLRRRGTRMNLFGITTHEKFELDGGYSHFLEGRMDASFGTTPLAMTKAIRLMEAGLVDVEQIVSHRFALSQIAEAMDVMATAERNKVMINP